MKCKVIDECRCFAYDDVPRPKEQQFCGVRRGDRIVRCPQQSCCSGGCPGDTAKEPFRIIKRPRSPPPPPEEDLRIYIGFILLALIVAFTT